MGAPWSGTGKAYVFSGRSGDTLHVFSGEAIGSQFGWSVAAAGDVNDDGYSDLIVGAFELATGSTGQGRVYVFSGAPARCCCVGVTDNIDNDTNQLVDISDLTFLIDHLFINFTTLSCTEEGNVDGDPAGLVDIADLTFLIDHLFITFPPTEACR